jgi:hypothetical protein
VRADTFEFFAGMEQSPGPVRKLAHAGAKFFSLNETRLVYRLARFEQLVHGGPGWCGKSRLPSTHQTNRARQEEQFDLLTGFIVPKIKQGCAS